MKNSIVLKVITIFKVRNNSVQALESTGYSNTGITYFQKAARICYFIALTTFTITLAFNQPDYYKNHYLSLILTDSISFIVVSLAFSLFLKKVISLKQSSAVLVYTTLADLAISTWYFSLYNIYLSGNFVLNTLIYCINILVAGFCIGRKHAFIAAGLYVLSFGSIICFSHDDFLTNNAFALIFLIIAFAGGISVFLYVLERSHKEEQALKEEIFEKDKAITREYNNRLQVELETKQKELTAKTMYLLQLVENNNAFIKKLNSLKKEIRSTGLKQLNTVIREHQIENHDKYWEDFETTFLEVNPGFYQKLCKMCPGLSPSELKLAALLRMGLSSKQIGNITSTTPESVDVARSRLRNKLNLPPLTNLKALLISL